MAVEQPTLMPLNPTMRTLALATVVVAGAIAAEWYVAAVRGPAEIACKSLSDTAALAELPEASGLAISRRSPDVLWSMNDSSAPVLFALDAQGMTRGRVRVTGASATDWEDVSIGSCPGGTCLYIADIGDNAERRPSITVYRVSEPLPTDAATAPVETFTATYPDGPHDAEALFVGPDGGLFVVTKDKTATVYRFPEPLRGNTTMPLQQVAMVPLDHVTDAEASVDGRVVAIRTRDRLVFYGMQELTSGLAAEGSVINLDDVGETQGEGVAMKDDGTIFLAGEGGGRRRPGTIASLTCRLPANR